MGLIFVLLVVSALYLFLFSMMYWMYKKADENQLVLLVRLIKYILYLLPILCGVVLAWYSFIFMRSTAGALVLYLGVPICILLFCIVQLYALKFFTIKAPSQQVIVKRNENMNKWLCILVILASIGFIYFFVFV